MRTRVFGRHHIRANFYNFVSILYVLLCIATLKGYVTDYQGFITGFILFAVDYFAALYDPHPDNMGNWFKAHFHRMWDNDED